MTVFFITGEWTALKRFCRRQVGFPEGMPSVYKPWLRYKQRGYDVHVFIIGDFKKADLIDFNGCRLHLVPRPRLLQNRTLRWPFFQFALLVDQFVLYRATSSVANKERPNIVYVYREQYIYIGWLLAKRFGAVFVKRFFGTWAYFNWFIKKTLSARCTCILEFFRWLWPSDLLIITNDGTSGNRIAELLGISRNKFRMWLNGVDKNRTVNKKARQKMRRRLGVSDEDLVLMCLSRLDDWKRQDRIINAMPQVLTEVPNAKLVIVGDGPKRGELERLAGEIGVEAQVQFTGMIEHDRVQEMISAADVFLQTNDVSCLGSTLLEAIVCGRPIVTWDVGTTSDVISDGNNGCLMPDAEPKTIAETVIGLAKSPAKRKALAAGARKFSRQNLKSWDERMDMEIELVARLGKGRRQSVSA